MVKELMAAAPRLCGIAAERAAKISTELMGKWEAEIAGLHHQRQDGQSVEQRLAPGFEWKWEVETDEGMVVFDYIHGLVVYAALWVDRREGRFVEAGKLEKVKRFVKALEQSPLVDEAKELANVESVETMDFWN